MKETKTATLNRLRMRAKSGDERALSQIFERVCPRLPAGWFFDRHRLHGPDDIESLKRIAIWKAVLEYDQKEDCSFETYAIHMMRWVVLDALRWKTSPPAETPVENSALFDYIDQRHLEAPVPEVDPRILLIKSSFERALQRSTNVTMRNLYELRMERPWLELTQLAEILGVTPRCVSLNLERIQRLLKQVRIQIMTLSRRFELNL